MSSSKRPRPRHTRNILAMHRKIRKNMMSNLTRADKGRYCWWPGLVDTMDKIKKENNDERG